MPGAGKNRRASGLRPKYVAEPRRERGAIEFAIRVAGQLVQPFDVVRHHERRQLLPAVAEQRASIGRDVLTCLCTWRGNQHDSFAETLVRRRDGDHVGDEWRGVNDFLDLGWTYSIARCLDHLVASADIVEITLGVAPYGIA